MKIVLIVLTANEPEMPVAIFSGSFMIFHYLEGLAVFYKTCFKVFTDFKVNVTKSTSLTNIPGFCMEVFGEVFMQPKSESDLPI